MAEDRAAHLQTYVPDANNKAIAGIVTYCGVAVHRDDSPLVAFTDKEEVARVRQHLLKKKPRPGRVGCGP